MSSFAEPTYRLASHVHACWVGSHLVFLDLKRDQYLGMDAIEAEKLQPVIADLTAHGVTDLNHAIRTCGDSLPREAAELLQQMLRDGMLETKRCNRRSPPSASVPVGRPQLALINGYIDIEARIHLRDIVRFFYATLTAAALLHWVSLERVAARIRRQRRHEPRCPLSLDGARRRMLVLERLRPLLYTSRGKCLYHSLVTREFLARYRIFPKLVFGVTTGPFKAHCWLQEGSIVVNDTPEYVREFTPILVL